MKLIYQEIFKQYMRRGAENWWVPWKEWLESSQWTKCIVCKKYIDNPVSVHQKETGIIAFVCKEDEQALRDWWGINREGEPK